MPELPEVEVVRRGLEPALAGRRVARVRVLHPRPVRRHAGGPEAFVAELTGRTFGVPRRRGKYLWLPLADGDAVLAHLGMSGQFRVDAPGAPLVRHTRVILELAGPSPVDEPAELRFVDQRMFGGLSVSVGGADLPDEIAHIARDLFDPDLDRSALATRILTRPSAVKRVLLDQRVVSGIGNIYADEALWRARIHGRTPARDLDPAQVETLLDAATSVMANALAAGGTSFDALYVQVNGESGYFDRSLQAYGRQDMPCSRCGTPLAREAFMNRSSFFCPGCQPIPAGDAA